MAAVGAKAAQELGVAAHHEDHPRVHPTREGEVPGEEQHGTREHQEPGVAEGELEANAQTRKLTMLFSLGPSSGCVSMR